MGRPSQRLASLCSPPLAALTRLCRADWFNPVGDAVALKNLFLDSWLNILLLTAPFGWASHFAGWDSYATFILNLVALVPLAMVIGKLTEDLATRYGDTIGARPLVWGFG